MFNQHTPPPPLKTMAPALNFSQDRESEENGSMLCRWKQAFRIAFTHIWVGGQIQFENTSCGSRFFSYEERIRFSKISCGVCRRGLSPWYWKWHVFVFLCCGTKRKRTEYCIFLTGDVGWMSGNAGPRDCRLVRTVTSAKKQSQHLIFPLGFRASNTKRLSVESTYHFPCQGSCMSGLPSMSRGSRVKPTMWITR